MKAISLVQTSNKDVNQLQQNISQSVNPIVGNPITQGLFLSTVSLKIGANTINHNLGYPMTGYLIVSLSIASSFSDNLITVPNPQTSFILNSSAATKANIYVF